MINAVIIEDEHKLREALFLLLQQHAAGKIAVVGVAGSVEEATVLINQIKPQVVFMDIQLKDGTGFDVLEKIKFKNFHLIFTTAYQAYAIKAFKYSAIDYLLKPIDPIELQNTLDKIFVNPLPELNVEQIQIAQNGLSKHPSKIFLPTLDAIYIVALNDIVRCETSGSYTTFYLVDKQKIMVSRPLKSYDELLIAPQFFRIHQSHTINIDYVNSYSKSGLVVLKDKTELPVAQRKKDEFLQLLATHSG